MAALSSIHATNGTLKPQGPPLRLRAVVVGGGVAGLTAARSLLDAGAQVSLYERRDKAEMLSGPAGLALQPNAMSALRILSGAAEGKSLADDVAAGGVWDSVAVVTTRTGQLLKEVPQDTAEPPRGAPAGTPPPVGEYICNLARPALQQALYAALPPGTVTCGTAFRSFRLREDGRVAVQLASEGQGGEAAVQEVACDLLVGADGIRSAVRASLDEQSGGPRREPVYSGYRYYRGLIDLTQLPGGVDGWRAGLNGQCNRFFYGESGTCILYQVSPTQASFARYTPALPGTSHGISPEQAKQAVVELCSEYGSPAPEMAAALRPADIHVGELWSMPPNKEVWGQGCVTLVGDAAHGLLPTLGQGAGQGIEDAVELAVALHRAAAAKAASAADGSAPVQLSAAELEDSLRRFEAARGSHVARVYDMAMSLFRSSAGETWLTRLRRDWTFRLVPISLMRSASAWLTHKKFSWEGAGAGGGGSSSTPAN